MGGRAASAPAGRESRGLTRGVWAESAATRLLEREGLRVLERNWRCRGGEIDVIAREPDGTTVFVEVKQRAGSTYGAPGDFIGARKAALVRHAALAYLRRDDLPCRFDAVLVDGTEAHHSLQWLKDAF